MRKKPASLGDLMRVTGEQKRRYSAIYEMAQMTQSQQPDYKIVLNFWHYVKGRVLKAQEK